MGAQKGCRSVSNQQGQQPTAPGTISPVGSLRLGRFQVVGSDKRAVGTSLDGGQTVWDGHGWAPRQGYQQQPVPPQNYQRQPATYEYPQATQAPPSEKAWDVGDCGHSGRLHRGRTCPHRHSRIGGWIKRQQHWLVVLRPPQSHPVTVQRNLERLPVRRTPAAISLSINHESDPVGGSTIQGEGHQPQRKAK